jgi:hypothetical protein
LTSGSKPANFLFVNQLSFKTMSHQFTSGVFLNSQPAWHKLGTVLDGTLPAREAFRIANADWETIAAPIFTADMVEILGHKAITRADTGNCAFRSKRKLHHCAKRAAHPRGRSPPRRCTTMDAVVALNAGRKRVHLHCQTEQLAQLGDVLPGDDQYTST